MVTEERLNEILTEQFNKQFAIFFGQITRYIDKRIDDLRDELKAEIDGLRITLDGVVKRLDDDRAEQMILNHRYEGWIGQLADKTGTTLTPSL